MKIFYFTATGNSLYVAKRIGGELYSIPQMIKEQNRVFEDDAIGFVFPCYSLGMPELVVEFIQKSQFNAKYFFAIMTYGNMAVAGLNQLAKIGITSNIRFNYMNKIWMVDNYLPVFKIEAEIKKESSKNIEKNLNEIVWEVETRQGKNWHKGFVHHLFSKLIHYFYKKNHSFEDKKFIVLDVCTRCKVCEKVCPRNNIKVEEKPHYHHNCESCYACIHNCPHQAIILKKERSRARFINQNVKLNEIIEANK